MRFAEPTPPEVRDRMREIFERAEFRRSRSLLERFMDWLSELFSDRGGDVQLGQGSSWGGAIGNVILWVAIVLLAIGLAFLIYKVVSNRSPRLKKKTTKATVEVEEVRSATEWASDADRLEAEGAWKEAIRCRYRELVARLVDAGVAAPQPGRTTGELRSDVDLGAPGVSGDFSRATGLFEQPWFADAPTGAAENAEFKALAARVLEEVS
ncbi:MAG TPA: DUF4129 domain-containing protein [Microthrixaceae bacterium]|nr:DUF4129 domain-containing protein [Microthrixaceae bacterium]HNI33849.1 DUF4129 domain-containing protein [Microthrixaceae bacterium]